ncbi:unnamed protein product [Brassicogethes aeneus]|uniref:Mitochondrial cardiolipin hydrolase n=1 Tax=Brassicogethes aeneus TaxID=1431903 RepID=A0A9P0AR19_BRAAE|nr:unnamed protein product [Brassicogethes aeneus]
MIRDLFKNKLWVLSSAALLVVPIYTWRKLYKSYKEDKINYEREVLFHKRHNCVVLYSPRKGMSGWPPHLTRIKANIKDGMSVLIEPIVYFINTAIKSIDIAVMILTCEGITNALIDASKRGIKVRILLNFEHAYNTSHLYRKMINEGVNIRFYVARHKEVSQSYSMMHYKYMLKDYCNTGGYVFMGSMNMSKSSFTNNFEDIVFTSTEYVVESVHENFEKCWQYVGEENKNDYNRTILLHSNLA